MKILITGGAGFIGSELARKFLGRGDEVVILDNLSSQVHGDKADFPKDLAENCECVRGDVRDKSLMERLVSNVNGILHMVAETGMGQSMYKLEQYADINVRATGMLLDIVANQSKDNIEKIFIPSSSRVYGEGHYKCGVHGDFFPENRNRSELERGRWEQYCPICGQSMIFMKNREEDMVKPTSIYGITKYAQEQMLLIFGQSHKIPCFSLRYQNVYGPGQSLINPYTGVLNIFAQQIKNGKRPEIYEMGYPMRDFVHIDDVVECTIKAFFSDKAIGKVFNVGGGESVAITAVAEIMMNQIGMMGKPVMSKKYRIGDILYGCADMARTYNELCWKAKVGLKEGIESFVRWLEHKEDIKNYSHIAENELLEAGLMGGKDDMPDRNPQCSES